MEGRKKMRKLVRYDLGEHLMGVEFILKAEIQTGVLNLRDTQGWDFQKGSSSNFQSP